MTFPARFQRQAAETGNLDANTAGTVTGHSAISTTNIAAGTLSCLFVVDAETDTLTIAGSWQVSDDNSTWYDLVPSNNAATVVLATGTSGADATVSKCLVCPDNALGWKFVRPAVTCGVTTGTVNDTYSMQVRYRRFNGFS